MQAGSALTRVLHRAMAKHKNPPRKAERRGQKTKRTGTNSGPIPTPRKGSKKSLSDAATGPSPAAGGSPWLYGIHPVLAALANPRRIHQRLVVARETAESLQSRLIDAVEAGGKSGMSAEVLDKRELETLLPPAAVHQGVALLSRLPVPPDLEDVLDESADREHALLVILDQASDPHNIGAVLRSAAAFGALALVLPDRHTPDVTGVLAKAASGALEQVPMIRVTNLVRGMDRLKEAGFWCIGLDGQADTTLPQATLPARTALVLGAEGAGLRRLTREHCDLLVKVPIGDSMESLNLSNAAAVALYEYARKYN